MVVSNIQKLLKKNKVSQKELAGKINVSQVTVNSILNKKQSIKVDTLQSIAKVFGVPVAYFFNETDLVNKTLENSDLTEYKEFVKHKAGVKGGYAPLLLIVGDDDALISYVISGLNNSYQIAEAQNGKTGLEKAIILRPDLIIIAFETFTTGVNEFCRKLKSDKSRGYIPIILLSSESYLRNINDAFRSSFDVIVSLPFRIKTLQLNIKKQIEIRKNRKDNFIPEIEYGPIVQADRTTNEEFIKKLVKIIQENLPDPKLGVEQLREELGMSRVHLHRKCKSILGLSPSEFIRSTRLKQAARLLKEEDFTVSEITYLVGFSSPSYFSNCFCKTFGVTPTEFKS